MKLVINKDWLVESDSGHTNLIVYKTGIIKSKQSKQCGERGKFVFGYFGTLKQVFKAMMNEEVMIDDLEDIKALSEKIDSLALDFANSCNEAGFHCSKLKPNN
jgi:hypothetical protein